MKSALFTQVPGGTWTRRAAAGLALLFTMGALGCGDGSTQPDPGPPVTPTLALALSSTTLSSAAGSGGTLTVNLTRGGGFSGAVELSLEGAPAGVTGTFSPASVAGSSSSSTLTIATTAATAPGTYTLTVRGRGTGVPDATAALAVTISAGQSIGISTNPTTLPVAQGASGTAVVTLTRNGGYAGAVDLSLEGAPAGMSGTFSPASVPGGATSSTLTLATTTATAPGTYTLTLRGRGTGVPDVTTALSVTVSAAQSIGVSVAPTSLPVAQGASGTAVVTLTRSGGYAGAVDLSLEGAPAGVTGSFAPASLPNGTTSSTLTLNVGANAAAGTSTLTLRARGQGVADQTVALTLTITAPPSGNVSFVYCGATPPLFVAAQNGSGAWTRVTPAGGRFSFAVSNVGGVAIVEQIAPNSYATTIYYGTRAELNTLGSSFCQQQQQGGKRITGSVAGVGATDQAQISMGNAMAFVFGGQSAFTLDGVTPGARDLIAARSSFTFGAGGISQATDRIIIRRALDLPNGATLPVLDFGSAEAFAPVTRTVTLKNLGSDEAMISVGYNTANTASALLGTSLPSTESTRSFAGVPTNRQAADDMHMLTAMAGDFSGEISNFRAAMAAFRAPEDRTLTFGPALATPTITTVSTTQGVLLGVQLQRQAEYNGGMTAEFTQEKNSVTISMTAGYLSGGASQKAVRASAADLVYWSLVMPNLFNIGYLPIWALQPGQVMWMLNAYNTSIADLHSPLQGLLAIFASRSGTYFP